MFSLRNVHVQYGDVEALNIASLDISAGGSVALVGASGSGKTTTLKVLSGLMQPTSGQVRFQDRELTSLPERKRSRLRGTSFGFVYQDYNLIPYLTAIENVEVSWRLRPQGLQPAAALDAVGLTARRNHLPHELSGGEQQRVSIARAICGDPTTIFADEPTGALDGETGRQVLGVLLDVIADDKNLIVVTHDDNVANQLGRTIALREGRLVSGEDIAR